MPEENDITDVDGILKSLFETVELDGSPVPVRMVTPDPDIVELVTPCITLMLSDVRRDGEREENDRVVEKDLQEMKADVRPEGVPYNLHYRVTGHGSTTREDRLLLEKILLLVEESPQLESPTTQKEYLLTRDISFRESSRGREYGKSVEIVVKARFPKGPAEEIPLVEETVFNVKKMGAE